MGSGRKSWIFALALLLTACGQTSPVAVITSPSPPASSGNAGPTPSPSASPSQSSPQPSSNPNPTSSPAGAATRLVIQDYAKSQVRLARFDAVDVATFPGNFDGVVGGEVVVVNGQNLLAVSGTGAVRTLGRLAAAPEWSGPGTVAVSPNLGQWLYTIVNFTNLTSVVHLASPTSDRVIATFASPDGNAFYQPFTWNTSGTYMVAEATGLGGVGPFLEYHFPLVKLDVTTGRLTGVSPTCVAERVLDDGTMICRTSTGGVEVRSPSGASHTIQVGTATSGGNGIYSRLTVSPDQTRFVAARNGNANPNLVNYQIVAGALSGTSAAVFGPADFYPDVWLPDGRIVADHLCWTFQQDGGPCNAALDGTYFLSADGKTQTLFFKLSQGASVAASV